MIRAGRHQVHGRRHAGAARSGAAWRTCPLAAQCITARLGRTITIGPDEPAWRCPRPPARPRLDSDYKATCPGPSGLLSQVTKAVPERALAEEMSGHLGYEEHDPAGRGSGNSRNGTALKTVPTDIGAAGRPAGAASRVHYRSAGFLRCG